MGSSRTASAACRCVLRRGRRRLQLCATSESSCSCRLASAAAPLCARLRYMRPRRASSSEGGCRGRGARGRGSGVQLGCATPGGAADARARATHPQAALRAGRQLRSVGGHQVQRAEQVVAPLDSRLPRRAAQQPASGTRGVQHPRGDAKRGVAVARAAGRPVGGVHHHLGRVRVRAPLSGGRPCAAPSRCRSAAAPAPPPHPLGAAPHRVYQRHVENAPLLRLHRVGKASHVPIAADGGQKVRCVEELDSHGGGMRDADTDPVRWSARRRWAGQEQSGAGADRRVTRAASDPSTRVSRRATAYSASCAAACELRRYRGSAAGGRAGRPQRAAQRRLHLPHAPPAGAATPRP